MSNSTNDSLQQAEFDRPSLPSGLNILTILTFIGSAIQLLFVVLGFVTAQKTYDEKDKLIEQMNSGEMPSVVKSIMPDPKNYEEMVTNSLENKIPILIIGLVSVALCIYGAAQMRKLKKSGFTLYLIGQILPYISNAVFIGFFVFTGIMFSVMSAIVILFILLYLTQRKYLVY